MEIPLFIDIGATIILHDPPQVIKEYCKNNLVITNPEYTKKARMGFWIGNTPKTLNLYKQVKNDIVLPYGMLENISKFIDDCKLTPAVRSVFEPHPLINYMGNVPLYDYQQKAVDTITTHHVGILQSPAGSGKTQMGIATIIKMQKPTLWITHTKDLLEQSKERAEQYIDKHLIGTITEGKVQIGDGVTFATIQTLSKLNLEEYANIWELIIIDECHRATGTPTAITQFYKVLNALHARFKYGLSATVHRADGMGQAMHALLGNVIHKVSDDEVKGKTLQVTVQPINTGVQLNPYECINTDGTLNFAKTINYFCEHEQRNKIIVSYLISRKNDYCLILSDRLEHLKSLMDLLPLDLKEQACLISGKMTTKQGKLDRKQAIDDMRDGKKHFLFATYALAKEGLDIPRLNTLFLTTPQKDYAVITQSIGRIARTFDGKNKAICYDFIDNSIYTQKAYKKRCTIYKKNKCEVLPL